MPSPALEIFRYKPLSPELFALLGKGVLPEYVPLPPSKETEFFSGLKRGVLNQLILPCSANHYRPPVKSISLRRPGCAKGKRLISLASLLDHLRDLQLKQTQT